jgi:hypothetical protein
MTGLRIDGDLVALLDTGAAMPAEWSPRPHLHPVTTRNGVVVTETEPRDHPHHAGVGLAIADVDGTNHWGGGTFAPADGYVLRGDHGTQRLLDQRVEGGGAVQRIAWLDRDGAEQLTETRTLAAAAHPLGWVLSWDSVLVAPRDLTIGSPATNGRPGAFYGGWLWRTPFAAARVEVAEGSGESIAHRSTSPWIAVGDDTATLVMVQRGERMPWFVRTEPHAYLGPALSVATRRVLRAGEPLAIGLDVLVADGSL